jgi:hypothetical protein
VLEKDPLLDTYEARDVIHVVPDCRGHLSGLLRRCRPSHNRRHRDGTD